MATKKKKAGETLNISNNNLVAAQYSDMHADAVIAIAQGLEVNAQALLSLARTLNGAGVHIDCMLKVDTK